MTSCVRQQHDDRSSPSANEMIEWSHSDQSEVSTLESLFYLTCRAPSRQVLLRICTSGTSRVVCSYDTVDVRRWGNFLPLPWFLHLAEGKSLTDARWFAGLPEAERLTGVSRRWCSIRANSHWLAIDTRASVWKLNPLQLHLPHSWPSLPGFDETLWLKCIACPGFKHREIMGPMG